MKRIFLLIFTLCLCLTLAVRASAAELPRLVDAADLLTVSEEEELLTYLDQVSEQCQADVVIVTMESCGGRSADAVINAVYDDNGYGVGPDRDGVILLLSMEERDYRILSNGFAADAITMSEIDEIGDEIVSELSDGEYMEAFMAFASLCRYEIDGERNGFPFNFGLSLGICVVIGFVTALIATGIMRSKLKSVRSRSGAREYTKPGSMQLTRSGDLFLYRTLDRRRKPQESSSGSRGGGGRNVGGGKF